MSSIFQQVYNILLTCTQIIISIVSGHRHQSIINMHTNNSVCYHVGALIRGLPHSTTDWWENPNTFFLRNSLNLLPFQCYLHRERWKDSQVTKIIPLFTNVAFFPSFIHSFTNIFDISVLFVLNHQS